MFNWANFSWAALCNAMANLGNTIVNQFWQFFFGTKIYPFDLMCLNFFGS